MRDEKGFSLIELLAALIIIGLILIIVIPATSRLLTSNEKKEYNNYFKIVETGAKTYANLKKDDLGSDNDTGCIEVTIADLVREKYIKEFNDKKVTCSGKVRINNDKGNLKVSTNITCVNDKNEETFKKENINNSSCVAFVPSDEDGLKNELVSKGLGSNGSSVLKSDNRYYIKGTDPNNYVWYSGKLWRVVSYDNNYIKLICNDVMTIMPRGLSTSTSYTNSLVDKWLKNTFLPTLKDSSKYLIDTSWDVSTTSTYSDVPNGSSVATSKVGLLNSYEAYNMGNFLANSYQWLISNPASSSNINTSTTGGAITTLTYDNSRYFSIRPAITMKSDISVISGNGSKSLPYILKGNSTNVSKGTLLNTRYSGEYLKINEVLYRVVKVINNLTKVIMVDNLDAKKFDDMSYDYSYSSLYNYLNSDWYENNLGSDKNLVYKNGSWCSTKIDSFVEFSESCSSDYITAPVGLPIIGDIFTSNTDGKTSTYWTINPYSTTDNLTMNVITGDRRSYLAITSIVGVKPLMYLQSNVIINSGDGTKDNPFILGLK